MLEGVIMLLSLVILLVVIRLVSVKKSASKGWRVLRTGNNQIEYAELDESGNWSSIRFESEMYVKGYPRHVIYIPINWDALPSWSQVKKDEILERITEKFKSPTYTLVER